MPKKLVRKFVLNREQLEKLLADALVAKLPDQLKEDAKSHGGVCLNIEYYTDKDETMMVVELYLGQKD